MTTLVQLYSARNFTPWGPILDQVKQLGYDGVEGFGGVFGDPAAFRAELDARGLVMPTGHFGLDLLEDDMPKALAIARTLGVSTIVGPWLPPVQRPGTRKGWEALASRLNTLDKKVREAGFGFGWHNHDFEFKRTPDGAVPIDILLDGAPGMAWEADLGWIFRAGDNPADWLKARAARIVAVHLKDVQPDCDKAPEGGWADLGHGINDWTAVFAALKLLPAQTPCIAEHDEPSDVGRFMRRWKISFDAMRRA